MWPFRKSPPEEDWRLTGEERWTTAETAGDYIKQHLEEKAVRFPDGETKWVRVPSNLYLPRLIVRIVKAKTA